jgi:hypothetical protein
MRIKKIPIAVKTSGTSRTQIKKVSQLILIMYKYPNKTVENPHAEFIKIDPTCRYLLLQKSDIKT